MGAPEILYNVFAVSQVDRGQLNYEVVYLTMGAPGMLYNVFAVSQVLQVTIKFWY